MAEEAPRKEEKRAALLLVAKAALASSLVLSLGCGSPDLVAPRLVILYATCTLNKSTLSPYDPSVTWTPHLQKFANRGVVFERHQTESGISGVAFASILSGRQADRHGVYSHPARLRESVELISESFAESGWDVYFWADHPMASPSLGYAQGVRPDRTFFIDRPLGAPDPKRRAREGFLKAGDPRFRQVLEGLRADPGSKALVITTFTVTHAPYSEVWLDEFCRRYPAECRDPAPETLAHHTELLWKHYVDLSWDYEETAARLGLTPGDKVALDLTAARLYAANVHRLDGLFGDVLAEIRRHGLEDASLVAFTADHGEVLRSGGPAFAWNHGFALAPEVLTVPWIVAGPGVEPARHVGVTRSIDVLPTLSSLAGVTLTDAGVAGRDLGPTMRGDDVGPNPGAFSHTALVPTALLDVSRARGGTKLDALHPDREPGGMWVAFRDGDMVFKLTRPAGGKFEPSVIDLKRDPPQTKDLYDPVDPRHAAAVEALRAYKRVLIDGFALQEGHRGAIVEEDQIRRLRSLGYLE